MVLKFFSSIILFRKGCDFMRKVTCVLLLLLFVTFVFGTAAFAIGDRLNRRIRDQVDLISEDIKNGIIGGIKIQSVSFPDYPEELTINPATGTSYVSADFPGDGIVTMLQYALGITSDDQDNMWRVKVLYDNTPPSEVLTGSPFVSLDFSIPANAPYKPKIGWIEYGDATLPEMVMSLGHIDTVGQGSPSGWDTPDLWLNPVIGSDGKMYGRGTGDDKGPTIASIYALKTLKDLGIPVKHRIRVMFGTDEERPYWYGINFYKRIGGETPIYGISPDGGITLHEKGIINAWPTVSFDEPNLDIYVVSVDSVGVAYNAITDSVIALIQVENNSRDVVMSNLIASIDISPFLSKDADINMSVTPLDIGSDELIRIESKAIPGHGASPTGINAYTRLMKVFTMFECSADFEVVAGNTLKAFNADTLMAAATGPRSMDHEVNGQTLGLSYVEDIFGASADVTINIGLADWKRDSAGHTRASFTLNMRFPQNPISGDVATGEWMEAQYPRAISGDEFVNFDPLSTVTAPPLGFIPNYFLAYPPMMLDPEGWRVESIRRVGRMTNDNGQEPRVGSSSGGGTYAKAFINRLFGMGTFTSEFGHGYNENILVSSIWPATRLMVSAFVEMAAEDNFAWDILGATVNQYTKTPGNVLTDLMAPAASFDAAVTQLGAFGIASSDVETHRSLTITSLDVSANNKVSFVVYSNENPLNFALFVRDATTGDWKPFRFASSIRVVKDLDSLDKPMAVSWDCVIAQVDALGSTNTSTVAGQYAAQYALAKGTGQIYFPLTAITMSSNQVTISTAGTSQLTMTYAPANATNKYVVWSSSNPGVATVNASGLVTGVSSGTATITATSEENSAAITTCTVTVHNPVTGVTLSPSSVTLEIDDVLPLTWAVNPSNATDPSVTWSSSNTAVASVTGGTVTALSAGTTTITVTTVEGSFEANCNITVQKHSTVAATPSYPSDPVSVAASTDIAPGNLEVKNNEVLLTGKMAETIAKGLLGVGRVDTNIIPVFEGTVTPAGRVAELTFTMTGEELLAAFPNEISLIGLVSGDEGEFFDYTGVLPNFDGGFFTLLSGGSVFTGQIDPAATYELKVFIEDGGKFDLDGVADGNVIAAIFLASEKRGGGGGGCNAGYVYLALALMASAPFVLKRQ